MKIIGHRGGTPNQPENTMAAFLEAQRLGADGIGFDVQQCSDGALVVIHDFTLDRTTNGSGLVAQTTSNHVASLDAGSWHSERFAGQRVPRLAEVLELDGLDFELELKGYGRKFLQSVLACVAEHEAFGSSSRRRTYRFSVSSKNSSRKHRSGSSPNRSTLR
jgi:glycerophosphoryl diester phosphodiesterase